MPRRDSRYGVVGSGVGTAGRNMGDIAHAAMAVVVAFFLYFPIRISLGILKATWADLRRSSEFVPKVVGGIVFLLNVGFPVALAVAPVAYNWEKHPLSSLVYVATLVSLFVFQPRNSAVRVIDGTATPSNKVQSIKNGELGSDSKPKPQQAGRCPHCGGPQSDRVCWSCGKRS